MNSTTQMPRALSTASLCDEARQWTRELYRRTRLIHMWIHLFVKNQCSGVPSFGNMCGYRLVFCAWRSDSDSGGPGYCRGGLRFSRWGCDGGRNLSGFSRTIVFGGIAVEALRIDNRGARRCRTTMVGRSREGLRAVKWRDEGLVIERSRR
jgi:hypothetical protein